jgi:hypothetical protein
VKIVAAVPAYDGKICVETVRSLLNEQSVAQLMGYELRVMFLPGTSLITMARNQLCADFLATDAERLVFIDADIAWEGGSLIRLAMHPVDVVGGAYRLKQAKEAYPIQWLAKDELWANELGLLEVAGLPTGFLAISRAALERLTEAYPDRAYQHMGCKAHAFFTAPFKDGRLWGEDAAFCADWREIGGQVWLDPEIPLTHVGGLSAFPGHVGNWLRNR